MDVNILGTRLEAFSATPLTNPVISSNPAPNQLGALLSMPVNKVSVACPTLAPILPALASNP